MVTTTIRHLVGFLLGSLAVVGLVSVVLVGVVAVRVPTGSPEFDRAMAAAVEDPTYVGPVSLLQGFGLTALALGLGWALSRSEGERLGDVLGLRAPSPVLSVTAAVGGLLVWIWPSWLATQLVEWSGVESSVQSIGELLVGPWSETWAMVLAVTVAAPLSEELLFRGYLWRLVERASGSREAALGLSTVLFALYHVDPVHVVALLPTAAFLGWLRYASRSLWPAILAHFVNNAAAVVVVQVLPGDVDEPGLALLGGAAFLAVVGVGAWLSRERSSGGPASPTRR